MWFVTHYCKHQNLYNEWRLKLNAFQQHDTNHSIFFLCSSLTEPDGLPDNLNAEKVWEGKQQFAPKEKAYTLHCIVLWNIVTYTWIIIDRCLYEMLPPKVPEI